MPLAKPRPGPGWYYPGMVGKGMNMDEQWPLTFDDVHNPPDAGMAATGFPKF